MTRKHIIHPGDVDIYGRGFKPVFIAIEYGNEMNTTRLDNLSITGVEGPKANGDAWGSCGQIGGGGGFREGDGLKIDRLAPGWTREMVDRLDEIWSAWHGNDMRAGCEHQRAQGWNRRPIDPDKPLASYGKHFDGQRSNSWNMLTWVRPDEHPDGLLTKECEVCGYKYGTAWLNEPVPDDVLDWLFALPAATKTPAWV
jgi:hypothetical protein